MAELVVAEAEAETEDALETGCEDDDDVIVNTEDDWYFESLLEVSGTL